jgi:hypothetical protein
MAASSSSSFDFITSSYERDMLENAYNAITFTEKWEFMRKAPQPNYQFSNDPEILQISDKMVELGYNTHSGSSFGYVMQVMQYIAVNGIEHYKIKYKLANKL